MRYYVFLFVAFVVWVYACFVATAGVLVLEWDKNPEPEPLTYQISYGRSTDKLDQKLPATEAVTTTTPELASGVWYFGVQAINATGMRGPISDVISYTVELSAPKKLRVVEIQTSSNLADWKTIALVPQDPDEAPAEFVRARISTVTP